MSNEIIYCFNKPENDENELVGQCIYEKCNMYSEEMDMCKLELLKGKPVTKTPTAPKRNTSKNTEEPEKQTTVGGTRLISSLKEGEKSSKANPINIKGTLVLDPIQKDVNTKKGPATVTSVLVKDESGEAKVSFWGGSHDEIMGFVKGDKLFFQNLFVVNEPYDGKPQIVGGDYYKVAKLN